MPIPGCALHLAAPVRRQRPLTVPASRAQFLRIQHHSLGASLRPRFGKRPRDHDIAAPTVHAHDPPSRQKQKSNSSKKKNRTKSTKKQPAFGRAQETLRL